jgi:hypothetical protein
MFLRKASHVGIGNHASGHQQDRGGTSEHAAAGKTRLRGLECLGNLGPHPAVGNLIARPLRSLIQAFTQQAFGFVPRFF